MADGYPELSEEAIPEGWERRLRSEDTVFRIPMASVVGRTVLYADADLESHLDAAGARSPDSGRSGDGDDFLVAAEGVWRFFFATALTFQPPLAPGVGPASIFPAVVSQVGRSFSEDLRARGFEDVDRERSEWVRTETGHRARLTKVTAALPTAEGSIPIEGWLGVWTRDGSFRVAGGAYPTAAADSLLEGDGDTPAIDPGRYREELLAMIRSVE